MKRSKADLKYIRDMKKAGWKLDYEGNGSVTFSKPMPKSIVKAMKKASLEGERERAKLAKEWLISFSVYVGFVVILNLVIADGVFGKIPLSWQLFIAGFSLISIVGQIFDRKNKIGLL